MFRFSVRSNRAHLIKWREWGLEAFQEAQDQDKIAVVFLVAFWCGFCQRMDETALSDDEVIALLNAFFVPIRVEESQRPDVDLRYNQGGWPTIAFLNSGGDHLFSVNYLDSEPFINLLVRLVKLNQQGKDALQQSVDLAEKENPQADDDSKAPLGLAIVAEIAGIVEGLADSEHGGYGNQSKFLHPEANDFLLYLFESTGESSYLNHVRLTLDKMRHSKTFDHSAGGFFRYSSKQDWSEPHPEKLLDDQATLIRNYLRAYLLTEESSYKDTATGLIDYLNSTLSHGPASLFLGCQDYVRSVDSPTPGRSSSDSPLISVIDEYVYCDANARAASAYLDAWWLLGMGECRERAVVVLDRLWQTLRAVDGGMCHYSANGQARVPGLLIDSVETGLAFLDAYSLLQEETYLRRAKELAQEIIDRHRDPAGGFYDISQTGPASLRVPLNVLSQNARLAAFLVKLADLSGGASYREEAVWALQTFPNSHRNHGAFAAGFGHALGRLLSLPVIVTIAGVPGDPSVLAMARAALTQLGCGDLLLQFREREGVSEAEAEIRVAGSAVRTVTDPADLKPELVAALSDG